MRIGFLVKIILLIAILPILSACEINDDCIEADDFGFDKPNISAAGKNKKGYQGDEYVDWVYTGLVYDGSPINILIRRAEDNSKWCSWFGYGEKTITDGMKNVAACHVDNNNWCPNPNDPDKYMTILNAPCYFDKGLGLYGLITNPNYPNNEPNINEKTNRNPCNIDASTFHLGDTMRHSDSIEEIGVTFSQGGDGNSDIGYVNKYGRGKFYLKILDNYYTDNSGQYRLIIKSGFSDPNPGPIAKIINTIVCKITGGVTCKDSDGGVAGKIFMNVIQNNIFLGIVKASLILYISFLGVGFALGLVAMNQQQLLAIMFKLVFVVMLIPSSSGGTAITVWNFFNQNLFAIFSSGFSSVLDMILNFSSNGSVANLGFFDDIYHFFTSKETHSKILSLLFAYVFPVGLFSIFIIYAGLFILLVCVAKAVIFYLLTVLVMGLLISLAPIFIVFLLFKQTKSLFEGWITQLTSYTIQPLLIFAGIGFMMQMIVNRFQKLLGFRVCPEVIIGFGDFNILKFWRAEPASMSKGNFHYPGSDTINGAFCRPYECPVTDWYINLPFLNPVNDAALINKFAAGDYYKLFPEFLVFGLLCYLVFRFNDIVPTIAKGIAGAQASQTDVGKAASSVMASLGFKDGDLMASTIGAALAIPSKVTSAAKSVRNGIEGASSLAMTGKYDTFRKQREEKELKKKEEKIKAKDDLDKKWPSMSKGEKAAYYAKQGAKRLLKVPSSMLKGTKNIFDYGRAYLGDDQKSVALRSRNLIGRALDNVNAKNILKFPYNVGKAGMKVGRKVLGIQEKPEVKKKYEKTMFEKWQDSVGGKVDKVEQAYNVKSEQLSKAAYRTTNGLIGSEESTFTDQKGNLGFKDSQGKFMPSRVGQPSTLSPAPMSKTSDSATEITLPNADSEKTKFASRKVKSGLTPSNIPIPKGIKSTSAPGINPPPLPKKLRRRKIKPIKKTSKEN